MLFRHSLTYLWARGLPSLVSFVALALYTRLLSPDQFGLYAMVTAGVFLVNAVVFQWLRLSLLRFVDSAEDRRRFLSTALSAFLLLVAFMGILAVPVLLFIADGTTRSLLLFGLLLLWLNAWLELNLTLMRARLEAARYGYVSVAKALLTVITAGTLAYLGWGAWGLLIGLALGTALPSLLYARSLWADVGLRYVDRSVVKQMLRYGLPLTASLSCSFIVRGSDRLLLGWLADSSVAGVYAAAYDLAQNSLEVLMGIINTAAFSLAVNALEREGVSAARAQLSQNISALFAVALPASVGLAFVAPGLAKAFLGASFQAEAAHLIPWVALAVLLSGLRAYYVDHAFQLGRNTMKQVYVLALAAGVNLLLNILLIPAYGAMGAAYATVVAYAVGLVFGTLLSRSAFALPFPLKELSKVVVATAGMALALWSLHNMTSLQGLFLQIGVGALVYAALLFLLNGLQVRVKWLMKRRAERAA